MRRSGGRHPNVPSLSTLLISDPPIIVIEGDQVAESKHTQPKLSPLLSPVDSNYASSISSSCSSPHLLSVNQSLPPLQGDDPPKRLKRHPSVSSVSSLMSNCSSSSLITKPTLWHVTSPSISPIMSFSLPSLSRQQQQQPSSTSTSSPPPPPPPPPAAASAPSIFTVQYARSPSPVNTEYNQRPPLPPSTQIIVNEEGETILKRRRGRPPNLRESSEEGGWTFLTPTVWDVKSQQPSQIAVPTEPISNQQQPQQEVATSVTNGGVAAFSSSTMSNTLLHMPRKKRGRKPKTQIAGNSCFVWKDISAARRSTKAMKLAQQQKEEKDNLDQGSTTSFTTATRLRRIEQAPAANTN